MKPEEQRIKIAEACGWLKDHIDRHAMFYAPSIDAHVGDPLNDLNAMHEAEKNLDRDQRNIYINILDGMPDDRCPIHHDFQWCCSTAAQRAEAFLRTLNLWKNE